MMDYSLWVGMDGPLAPYASGYGAELARLGWTPRSADNQRYMVRDLSVWLAGQGLGPADLDTETVARFVAWRRRVGRLQFLSVRGLEPLLVYLRGCGVAPPVVAAVPASAAEVLLERFRGYLVGERALTEGTATGYVRLVRELVAGRDTGSRVDLDLDAADVAAFVVTQCRRRPPKTVQHMASALRALLRFLYVEGLVAESLTAAVPSVAYWRQAGLPQYLEAEQVRALLDSCDVATATGRRDLAILTMLARMGLRCGEVARLELDDIDWASGQLRVVGKGGRVERIPLPADVGQLIVNYLADGRPTKALDRCVFIRLNAPLHGLTPLGVTYVVVTAGRRAGLGWVTAHRLRHTAATRTLRAGSSLAEVGQLLRHQRPATTAIYAKVDLEALRALARPWPILPTGGGR